MARRRTPEPPPEPKRHERGWHQGSVKEVRPGAWRAWRPRQHHADGTTSRPSATFATHEQAELWAAGVVEPSVLLLGHWLDRWLSLRLPTISQSTQRNYRSFVAACAEIATVPLAGLSHDIMQAQTNLLLSRWSRGHVHSWRGIISAALKAAVPQHIPHNPMAAVRLPRAQETPPKAWTAQEVASLLETARGRAHEVWLWLSLGTGIRMGEARALTWPDVDLTNRTVTIRQSRDHLTDELGPTKSRRVRVVDLPDEVIPLLVAHRVRQSPRERHVCTSSFSGRVPHPRSIDSWLRQVCEDAGVTPHGPHSTRHTYATLALEAGVPLKEVSEALGHSSVAITASTYSHTLSTRQRRAANAIGAVLAPKPAERHENGSRRQG